ncbi:hypothetical protein Noda2021_01830 [Candidatus Dependentiae bacterium Noda2021]|nr:hypothetical protein Noda2021_01830 [Candidatus Dependentiae bacterium Noda2021]
MKTCNTILLFLAVISSPVLTASEYPQQTKTTNRRTSDDEKQKTIVLTSLLYALMHNEITSTNNQVLSFPHYKTSSEALTNKLTFFDFKQNILEILQRTKTLENNTQDVLPAHKQDLHNALVQFEKFKSGTDIQNMAEKKKNKLNENRSILITAIQQGTFDDVQSAIKLRVHYTEVDRLEKEIKQKRCLLQ